MIFRILKQTAASLFLYATFCISQNGVFIKESEEQKKGPRLGPFSMIEGFDYRFTLNEAFQVLPNPNHTELRTSTPFQLVALPSAWMLVFDSAI